MWDYMDKKNEIMWVNELQKQFLLYFENHDMLQSLLNVAVKWFI